jgi:hypothetical protein
MIIFVLLQHDTQDMVLSIHDEKCPLFQEQILAFRCGETHASVRWSSATWPLSKHSTLEPDLQVLFLYNGPSHELESASSIISIEKLFF